ncbi:MAG: T9SS type A sorting domain-containing protein [Bacteroidota bacterium]
MFRFLYHFCLFAFLFIFQYQGNAATITWTNTAGGTWTVASNWSPAVVPANNDDVIINVLTNSTKTINGVPTVTLNSLTGSGSGFAWLEADNSGNIMTFRNSLLIPSTYTLRVGNSNARLVFTVSVTCTASLSGVIYYDAGSTNRIFTLNGKMIVPQSGGLYDPNPSSGSDFIVSSTGTIVTGKIQGITTTSVSGAASINTNVAICFGGSYTYAAGASYEYNGTSGQLTGTGLSQNAAGEVTVNLSAGQTLTLSNNATISGSLVMTSGTVNLNGLTLTLGTSGAATGTLTRSAGFLFNGTFTRWFATATVAMPNDAGLFPMGTSQADYRPLWVGYSTALTTAGNISVVHTPTYPAWYVAANHADASWSNTVIGVSNSLWAITTASIAFNGNTAQIRYGGTGYGTNTLTDLNASLVSSVTGSHSASTNANTTYEVNRTNLSTASIANSWRIGTKNITNSPLPITLRDFNAKMEGDRVKIYWSTGSEKNNHYFVVEKSKDGIHYTVEGIVDSKGDSEMQQDYYLYDNHSENCSNYYRLKQVDYDGAFKLSKTVVVCNTSDFIEVNLFPNPSQGIVNFYSNNDVAIIGLEIYNAHGVKIFTADTWIDSIDLSTYPVGVYSLNFITNSGGIISKKFFLNN